MDKLASEANSYDAEDGRLAVSAHKELHDWLTRARRGHDDDRQQGLATWFGHDNAYWRQELIHYFELERRHHVARRLRAANFGLIGVNLVTLGFLLNAHPDNMETIAYFVLGTLPLALLLAPFIVRWCRKAEEARYDKIRHFYGHNLRLDGYHRLVTNEPRSRLVAEA